MIENSCIRHFDLLIIGLIFTLSELCGTPGYLAPELLRSSMYENAEGYGKDVDM